MDSRSRWLLAGIILLGAVVRFSTLGVQSFWSDEATTYGIVTHGLGHVFSTVPKTESTPHLYYVLLWFWSRLFGTREVGLRSLSALCGTLTIPVVCLLGKRLISERVGLVAALLAAVNPLLFWYSQEARSYALLTLLSALSLLALVWALESPSPRRLLGWGLISALALSAHYFAAFLIVLEAIWLVLALRRRGPITLAHLAAGLAPIVVVGGALLPLAIRQNDGRASFIATHSGSLAFRLTQLAKQDVVAYDGPSKTLTSIAAVLLVSLGVALLVRANRRERLGALQSLVIGGGAVLLAVIVAIVATDYVNTRNLLESWPALVLVLAAGLGAEKSGRLGLATLAALVAVSLACVVGVDTDSRFQRGDWRGAAQGMGSATVPRAIVGDHNAPTALHPYMADLSNFPAGTAVQEVDVFALVYRKPGARVSSLPPRPSPPPTLPGFTLFERREADGYTVLRYRSPIPIREDPATLERLGLLVGGAYVALLQKPA